jgi:hypothetical protein
MKIRVGMLALTSLVACGQDRTPGAQGPQEGNNPPGVQSSREETLPLDVPGTLTCITSAQRNPTTQAVEVARVSITHGEGASASVSVETGPQFLVHGEQVATPAAPVAHAMNWTDGSVDRVFEETGGLRLAVHRDGAVLRGTFQPAAGAPRELTCWNLTELFGSPWSSPSSGTLTARYDSFLHTCVDNNGAHALNAVPVELVRETGNGECTDLQGQALNGDDYSYPTLEGWNLKGARLDNARLFFANLDGANFFGTDLSGLQFGYARIYGSTNPDTVLPAGGACQAQSSPWSGETVTCEQ